MPHRSTLPRCRRKPGIGGHLPAVAERTEETFGPKHSGELGPDPSQPCQRLYCYRSCVVCGLEQGIALRFHGFELLKEQLQPVEFAADLRLQVRGQGASGTGPQRLQLLAPITAQGLVIADALGEQQTLDPFNVRHPLCYQRPALAAEPAPVLLLRARYPDHVQTRGSPRLYAKSVRSSASPSMRSVFALRRRREVRIEAASTTWLSMPARSSTRWIQKPSRPAS